MTVKQPPHKRLTAWFLTLVMTLTLLPVGVLALEEADDVIPAKERELSLPDEEVPSISVEITETVAPAVGSQSDAELLEGYLYAISGIRHGSPVHRVPPRPLTVELKDVEDELKGKIKEVAAGELASTQFSFSNKWTKTKAEWGITGEVISGGVLTQQASEAIRAKLGLDALMQKQLLEMPYELYWYNKTKGVSMGYSVATSGNDVTVRNLTISMNVSQDYAKFVSATSYNPFEADAAKTGAAATAAANALNVVAANTGKNDYEKLVSYREYIKGEVSYNTGAAGGGKPYGDPWQLIYVFDGKPATNVVCEGYAKAFQYLCDLTFQNQEGRPSSSLVSGKMDGGDHMWNVVAIGGRNYLVDVTNCDTGSIGAPDQLFLCGAAENVVGKQYTVTLWKTIVYEYDEKTVESYAPEHLKLSPVAYDPNAVSAPSVSGKVKSYNPNNPVTVRLIEQGHHEVAYETTIDPTTGSGQKEQNFSFDAVAAGTYDLVVTKAAHLSYTVTGVVVKGTAIDLTKHTNAAISTITLLCGDIDGDGWIDFSDYQELLKSTNYGKQTSAVGVNKIADLDGDTWIDFSDYQILLSSQHYGKSTVSVSFAG
mgnify:CR=1 FL=1